MYTKLDTDKVRETDKSETIRQDNCGCACNSATDVPEKPDSVIIAKNLMANQLEIDATVGGG